MSDATALATLLMVEEQALRAPTALALAFVMVNETRMLVDHAQAALHIRGEGVKALSAVSSVDRDAPFVQWLTRAFREVEATGAPSPATVADWAEWLPAEALWLPLSDPAGRRLGTLLLVRGAPWDTATETLLSRLVLTYGHAWAALHRPSPWVRLRAGLAATPRWRWGVVVVALALLLLPVRLSVLAPADIVPHAPAVIRAPLEGVIESVHVRPAAVVKEGDPLFDLDRTTVHGRLGVAETALSTARAELDQLTQQAFFDPAAKARLAVVRARVTEREAERAELRDLLARAEVRAPRDGVAVMDDASEWIGKPVGVGERVLAVADPAQVEVEAWLAPGDVIPVPPGAPVTVFLDIDPLAPVSARLDFIAYEPTQRPDGLLAHRLRATLVSGTAPPRLGLKGTARLDGARVPLIYWLFRRPLAVMRQWVGL